jgi:DNA-binding HxlR family transcriptional regulator
LQNADYLVVIELLRHPDGRPHEMLRRSLDVELETLDVALRSLEQDGVIVRQGEAFCPSSAVRRLDSMKLIAI